MSGTKKNLPLDVVTEQAILAETLIGIYAAPGKSWEISSRLRIDRPVAETIDKSVPPRIPAFILSATRPFPGLVSRSRGAVQRRAVQFVLVWNYFRGAWQSETTSSP